MSEVRRYIMTRCYDYAPGTEGMGGTVVVAASDYDALHAAAERLVTDIRDHWGSLPDAQLIASLEAALAVQLPVVTLICEDCRAEAELPRIGHESAFVSLRPANGWTLFPNSLCPKCRAARDQMVRP